MKYLMTLAMAVLLVTSTTAQDKMGETAAKSRVEMLTEHMTKELGLNADQVVKVEAINKKYAEKAMGRASAISTQEVQPEAEAVKEMNEALKAVLTPKQFEQWMKKQSAAKGTAPDGREINDVEPAE